MSFWQKRKHLGCLILVPSCHSRNLCAATLNSANKTLSARIKFRQKSSNIQSIYQIKGENKFTSTNRRCQNMPQSSTKLVGLLPGCNWKSLPLLVGAMIAGTRTTRFLGCDATQYPWMGTQYCRMGCRLERGFIQVRSARKMMETDVASIDIEIDIIFLD